MKTYDSVVISIDIEARGQGPKKHGILSIGVCVGRGDSEDILQKVRFDLLPLLDQTVEHRCWESFWSKHKELYNTLTTKAEPAEFGIAAFRRLIDFYDSEAKNVYIVCDNPAFDFGMINYYLDYFNHPTLSYTRKGEYRNVHDADSYGRGMLKQGFSNQWMSNDELIKFIGARDSLDTKSHNHMPENDAEFIYRLHYRAVQHNK